ncbi:hypothetical protein DFQ27_007161 [Actinomortierella ambigua]|uniref:DUF7721 domain-containing protein n=1 Tax=Actinomortierella ambigua TaxID=1343610 RepID=A0A9P6PVI1_9FUNG|nr:hypothetical protein DFQ27_007161 [Actinomortierella ambigua]
MDQFISLAAQFDKNGLLQKFAGHDDDDKEAVNKSLDKVEREGVREADDSDIHQAKAAHDKVYSNDQDNADDDELGKAAGTQAFKSYEEESERSGGSAGGKDALVQMAIAEAMKLMGKSGGGSGGGDKSAILQTAITTAMGLFMSKNGSGGSSGTLGALMSALGGGGASGKKSSDGDNEGGSGSGGSTNPALGMLAGMGGEKGQALAGMLGKFM